MTVMQDGSIQCVVNKGRCKSMKSEPVSSPSVTRSFAFDLFPKSASSENTLWDNDATWTATSYTPVSLFPLFNEYQKDDETESHQLLVLLVHEVRGIFEDDLCSKVTILLKLCAEQMPFHSREVCHDQTSKSKSKHHQ